MGGLDTTSAHSSTESFKAPDLEKAGSVRGDSVVETPTSTPVTSKASEGRGENYLTGARFYFVVAALSVGVFLVNFEITVVATSLVSIANDLHGFSQSSWIITAYLVTYTGLLVISAKFSDIFGRKPCVLFFFALFTIFSGACGAAQNMTQLIVLRAMQGIGGAGANAIIRTIFFDLFPKSKYAKAAAYVSFVYGICFLVGPLVGGAINENTTWRWVFLLNAPAGAAAMLVLFLALPRNFPYHGMSDSEAKEMSSQGRTLREQLGRIDYVGAITLLAATVLLITALQEANTQYSWDSAAVICMLVFSGVIWVAFFLWSWWRTTRSNSVKQPMFPWRFVQDRSCIAMLSIAFITGGPMMICVYELPLRFQSVNGLSPLASGIRLLPFSVLVPLGSIICSSMMGRLKISPMYLILAGSLLQLIGLALLGFLPATTELKASFYGLEAIVGLGIGFVYTAVTVAMQVAAELRDKAVASSAVLQFRFLGGVIGIAAVTAVFNNYVRTHLLGVLDPSVLSGLLQSTEAINHLPAPVAGEVRLVLVAAYNLQLRIAMGLSIAQVVAAVLGWKKR